MILKLKPKSTSLAMLQPQALFAIQVAYSVFLKHYPDDITVTDIYPVPGQDARNPNFLSYHYLGLAVDIDVLPHQDGNLLAEEIRVALDYQYDVVFHKGHIHIEYEGFRRPTPRWKEQSLF